MKRAADWLTDAAPVALVLVLALALALLLVLMLGYTAWGARIFRRVFVIRYILRPRFTVADLDDRALAKDITIGPAMSGRIKERLQRFREDTQDESRSGYRLHSGRSEQVLIDTVQDDTGLSNALGKLGDASENGKLLAAMVGALVALLPIRRYTLTGIIEPSSDNVPLATIALQRNGRLLGTVAVGLPPLKEPPPSAAYLRLCDATAVWAQYHMTTDLADETPNARMAESYAAVRHAMDLDDDGDQPGALAAYDRAIGLDAENWTAHANRIALLAAMGAPDIEDEILEVMEAMEMAAAEADA